MDRDLQLNAPVLDVLLDRAASGSRPGARRDEHVVCLAIEGGGEQYVLVPVGYIASVVLYLAIVAAFAVLVVLMPPVPRAAALAAVPFAVVGAFMTAHGLIGTLASFFSAGESDSSIQYRTHDYPLAEAMWQKAPWFGHQGGTGEREHLRQPVPQHGGRAGAGGLHRAPGLPPRAGDHRLGRGSEQDPELPPLCAALAGAGLAAAGCSATFDSLAFPMFLNVYALVIGLAARAGGFPPQRRETAPERHPERRPLGVAGRA